MRWSVFVTLWLLVLPAAAVAETRTDINHSKDFSRYKTYTLEVNPPVRYGEVDENNTITENRFRRAVEYQLRLHGLTPAPTAQAADVVVRVSHREDERTELVSSGPAYPWGWYGPWGYGYGGYWGAPYWGGDVWTYRYLEGTTRIDVLENSSGDLVYRAEVMKKVDDDEEDLDHDALKIAEKAFKKFPVRGVRVDD